MTGKLSGGQGSSAKVVPHEHLISPVCQPFYRDFKKMRHTLAGVAQWIECQTANQQVVVRFSVRAHAWVACWVPGWGHVKGNHVFLFLSLSCSFLSFLSL